MQQPHNVLPESLSSHVTLSFPLCSNTVTQCPRLTQQTPSLAALQGFSITQLCLDVDTHISLQELERWHFQVEAVKILRNPWSSLSHIYHSSTYVQGFTPDRTHWSSRSDWWQGGWYKQRFLPPTSALSCCTLMWWGMHKPSCTIYTLHELIKAASCRIWVQDLVIFLYNMGFWRWNQR
jgi:hypothetical protein